MRTLAVPCREAHADSTLTKEDTRTPLHSRASSRAAPDKEVSEEAAIAVEDAAPLVHAVDAIARLTRPQTSLPYATKISPKRTQKAARFRPPEITSVSSRLAA